ncbi:hypothetical protein Goshw_024947 [Gossypium schwendimanii]|uniref:Uncharacterized protein n=1 Tax=Gossypium schwendimanii TaxID=34291 RepID=A0A7J9MPW1_GOSSC|nr:hypothetical protein [Gossypium schwendimanii]
MDPLRYEVMHCNQKVEVFFPHLVTGLCRKAKILLEDHEEFMKPTKNHSTLDSMRQGTKEEKNRRRLPRKIFKGMRMIMRQHSSRKIPHQRGPSYEAQPDMHLRRVRAPIKDMAQEKEKYK